MLRFLNWPRRLIWKMKYGRLAMSDCPVMGGGAGARMGWEPGNDLYCMRPHHSQ